MRQGRLVPDGPCEWKFNLQITFMDIHLSHYANLPKCIIDTDDIQKTLDVFYIYFFGQWFVEIKLKKLSILACEFASNLVAIYWYKRVATPCSRHDLWFCQVTLQFSTHIDHFFLTYPKNVMEGFSLTQRTSIDWQLKIWSCRGRGSLQTMFHKIMFNKSPNTIAW